LEPAGLLIIVVFVVVYLAITSERVNRTAMSLTGMAIVALILWILGTSDFKILTEHIEWSTILFVTGQMIIVTVSRASGMYQYLALTLARPSGGNPHRLFITFIVFVFFISLFFDTTSTMLIIGPLTIEVCRALALDFKPFLVSEAIVANYASIPSVVGDVPNLVIWHATQINAGSMFIALIPLSVIFLLISLPLMLRYLQRTLKERDMTKCEEFLALDPKTLIHSRLEFYMSVGAMIAIVLAFTIGNAVGLEPSLVVMTIAAVMLMMTRREVEQILRQVGWGTIFFIIGLFGIVAALDLTGVLTDMTVWAEATVGSNKVITTLFMFWIPGVISAVIDNVPIAALLAPLAATFTHMSSVVVLALISGVNIGAFILPIGSPANIIALALSETEKDPIGIMGFAKVATPMAILMMLIGTGYLLLLTLFI